LQDVTKEAVMTGGTKLGLASGLLVALAAVVVGTASGTFAGENGRIAFTMRTETGNFDIYSMNPDGTAVTQVTTDPATDRNPRWSPDGERIAFSSDRSGDFDIWVVNADGTNPVQVSGFGSDGFLDSFPTWSADGRQIVFQRGLGAEIRIANAGGSGGEIKLADGFVPGASTHGKKVAFSGATDVKLHVLNLDDGTVTDVTSGPTNQGDFEPNWSPRGNDLVFSRDTTGTQSDLYVVHADGSGLDRLTDTTWVAASENSPVWSPDGERIAFTLCDFTGGVQGNCSIATMARDGTDVTPIAIQGALFRVGGRVDWQAARG
jgi:Tol biopolymer transport system component